MHIPYVTYHSTHELPFWWHVAEKTKLAWRSEHDYQSFGQVQLLRIVRHYTTVKTVKFELQPPSTDVES